MRCRANNVVCVSFFSFSFFFDFSFSSPAALCHINCPRSDWSVFTLVLGDLSFHESLEVSSTHFIT